MRPLHIDEQLSLRPIQLSDAPDLHALVEDNREQLQPWMGWIKGTGSLEETEQFILSEKERKETDRGACCAILFDDRLVGVLSWFDVDWNHASCELGYWLDSREQGRGYMTRCCRALLSYLFGDRALHRVVIQCAEENQRSRAVPERLGFTLEGVLRESAWTQERWLDHAVYSLLDHEWDPDRSAQR